MADALIFGAGGQDGYYLAQALDQRGYNVIGVSRSGEWINGDVADFSLVSKLIKKHKPGLIFHLAAVSTTRHSALFENHETISGGALNILESVREYSGDSKVFITGSGVQFRNDGSPISEQTDFLATSPYSIARIHSAHAARYYRELGVNAYVGYLFHHESILRTENHVSQKVVKAVQRIKSGSLEKIELGDISVAKEWSYAGDIAEGVLKLMGQDLEYEAIIGSGVAYSIEQWLEACFGLIDKNWHDYVRIKDNFSPEYSVLVSDPSRIKNMGWEPKISFEELAERMVNNQA